MTEPFPASETDCADCPFRNPERLCMNPEGRHPETCPTQSRQDVVAQAQREYEKPHIRAFAHAASARKEKATPIASAAMPT